MSTASLLDRVLSPIGRSTTVDAAEEIVALRADAETQNRVDELAAKNTEGTLTAKERDEYAEYVAAFNHHHDPASASTVGTQQRGRAMDPPTRAEARA
jgi:hypothetical protein